MTSNNPGGSPTLEALVAQWEQAQEQFRALREAVEHASRLAELKEQGEALARQRDFALRSLGEAVWAELKRGRLELPRALGTRIRELHALERQREAQAAEISALLAEGTEAAQRVQRIPPPVRTPVTKPGKKR